MENNNGFSMLSEPIKALLGNQEFNFVILDSLPTPIKVWDAEGTTIFSNRAGMKMAGVTDASLIVGKYNLKHDPVCLEIMGQEVMDRIFRGETVTFPDFPAPVQDLVDREVITEKPWEAATMDLLFVPLSQKGGSRMVCSFNAKKNHDGPFQVIMVFF